MSRFDELRDRQADIEKRFSSLFGRFKAGLAVEMGSGMSDILSDLKVVEQISFSDLLGAPSAIVEGHPGRLLMAYYNGSDDNREHTRTVIEEVGVVSPLGCLVLTVGTTTPQTISTHYRKRFSLRESDLGIPPLLPWSRILCPILPVYSVAGYRSIP